MASLAPPIHADEYMDVLCFNQIPNQLIPYFKTLLKKSDEALIKDFYNKADIIQLIHSRAWYVEQITLQLWKRFIDTDALSFVAVGGFGRGELHPYSDVDLLILIPRKNKEYDEQVTVFIQSLWDIGLDIGMSVRTPNECLLQARDNVTVATNLMEARLIFGNKKLYQSMQNKVTSKKIWKGEDFFNAKIKEQKLRHKKYSDTTYNVEPNIKEGQGGLRDIQMVSWVAQRFFQTDSLHELVDEGFLTEYEYIRLIKGQAFLWRVRFALHVIARRKEDRILFDYQLKLAKIFGYDDEGIKNPAVEQFMQIFYRNVMRLERMNARLLQLFDENILKQHQNDTIKDINQNFHIVNNFLEIKETNLFRSTPTVWFELFLLIQKHPEIQGIRADTVRAMRHYIEHIDRAFQQTPYIQKQFIQILQQQHKVAAVLNQMNRLGILAKYLPVFGRIVGRMQFDLFHIYTVDQHSLFAVRNLCLLRHNKTDVIRAKQIFANIDKPYLVYIGALFHDIAKGREGHHAVLGAEDAKSFCDDHRIFSQDKALVVWLVKYHLIMSETAQKRDLNDIDTIKTFASKVGSMTKLRSLYLLTIADISATDPKLWNSYKQDLLHELFIKTKHYLTDMDGNISLDIIKQNLTEKLISCNLSESKIKRQIEQFPVDLLAYLDSQMLYAIHQLIATQAMPIVADISDKTAEDPHTKIEREGNTIAFVIYCNNFKGLFYIMVSILEKYNFTVVDANINNTINNYALNIVRCLSDSSIDLQDKMINEMNTALQNEKYYHIRLQKHTPIHEKLFKIKSKVKFLKSNNSNDSLIEVICRDKHGLLSHIANELLLMNISINAAKIVTVGARAEFTYWLSINQQPLNNQQLNNLKQKLLELL